MKYEPVWMISWEPMVEAEVGAEGGGEIKEVGGAGRRRWGP
jgi:hypothetical protein